MNKTENNAAVVDHAAELRAAILQTRAVFEGQPGAADVIEYLEQVLAAAAPLPAQTGTAVGLPADYIDLIVTTGRADASIAKESLAAAGAALVVVEKSAADQAAAAMVAESEQLVIQAEKAVAGAAARAEVDRLAVLSREVFTLADKLQQPADLVVQLMVLAELRDRCGTATHSSDRAIA
jgi:hypothetical protein